MSAAQQVQFQAWFSSIVCCQCAVQFFMPNALYNQRKEDRKLFYCPNGHGQHFTETEVQKLKKQLEAAERQRKWAEEARDSALRDRDHAQKAARTVRGHMARLRKRVGNGVCPCCSRSFVNLRRHIATKHPEFTEPQP